MPLTEKQLYFLEQIALQIPDLISAVSQGNLRSEYTLGVRRIGDRHVRLKMVAEVVDAGANPLQTHSTPQSAWRGVHSQANDEHPSDALGADVPVIKPASKRRRPRKR